MVHTTHYLEQSKGLPVEDGFQLAVLGCVDRITFLREASKVAAVAGLVGNAASMIFNYNTTLPLIITAVGGVTWFCCSKMAQKYEPQAKEIIRYFRGQQRERKSAQHRGRKHLLEELQSIVKKRFCNSENTKMITRFLTALFSDTIESITTPVPLIMSNKIEIQLCEAIEKRNTSRSTTLYIPKKLKFELESDGGIFFPEEKFAPHESCTNCCIFKSNFVWWHVSIKGEELELSGPSNVGIFTVFFTGEPPFEQNVDAKTFIESIE